MGSSRTRARTCVPCIGRRILNHCTTREAPHCVLMEIGHTVWNRSMNAPVFMVLESVPQVALSLCLLEGRPKKLRSLWDYWKHNLHQHFQPGARDLHSTSRNWSSLCKWHLKPAVRDKITQEKRNGTKMQSPWEQRHFRVQWRQHSPRHV